MIRLNTTDSYGIMTSQVITEIDDRIKDQAIKKLDEYISLGICADNYENPVWVMTNKRDRYYFTFCFDEKNVKSTCQLASVDYLLFIDQLKVFIVLLIGRCSLEFLRELISFTLRETVNSEFYSKNTINYQKYNSSLLKYYSEFVSLISPTSKPYISLLNKTILQVEYQNMESANGRKPCILAEFQTYFIFDEIINEWWQKAEDNSRYYFYPLYLFWRLTTILPLRVMEFCLTPYNCISVSDNNYYITIRRTILKGNNGSKKIIKHHYNLDDDYKMFTYQVTEEIATLFSDYAKLSSDYFRNDNLLFSLDFMQKYNPSIHKKNYDQSSVFNVEALNKLLNDFYTQVIINEYDFTIVSDNEMRERYIGMNEDSYNLQTGEIMKIECKHTRHLSMINLVYCGCNPMIVKDFAGHADESISANYYGNTTKTAKCITKILYDKYKGNSLKRNALSINERAPLSTFIDETGQYIELDNGKCYSHEFINNSEADCKKYGFDCQNCSYYIPNQKDSVDSAENEIDEEMKLISALLKRDDIDQRLEEYQTRYINFQQKLGRFIKYTWEDQYVKDI